MAVVLVLAISIFGHNKYLYKVYIYTINDIDMCFPDPKHRAKSYYNRWVWGVYVEILFDPYIQIFKFKNRYKFLLKSAINPLHYSVWWRTSYAITNISCNLKFTNEIMCYNWSIGTVERLKHKYRIKKFYTLKPLFKCHFTRNTFDRTYYHWSVDSKEKLNIIRYRV